MPREVLTKTDPGGGTEQDRPVVGFFGKLPSTGDFVSRGLPDAFRQNWDVWVTRHVAPLQRDGATFPAGGLRFQLASGGRTAAGMILPSRDSAGRLFPLSVMLIADDGLTQTEIDAWCDKALVALARDAQPPISADDLWQALDALPTPKPAGRAVGIMQLWTATHPAITTEPNAPEDTIRQLLA
jgi:type VI secretion system protein ImpM